MSEDGSDYGGGNDYIYEEEEGMDQALLEGGEGQEELHQVPGGAQENGVEILGYPAVRNYWKKLKFIWKFQEAAESLKGALGESWKGALCSLKGALYHSNYSHSQISFGEAIFSKLSCRAKNLAE